jgi:hypothetical protein
MVRVPQLAVTTETDFGVSMPVMAAEVGCAGVFAADPVPPHPHNEPAANRIKSAHVGVFMNWFPPV